MLTKVCTRKPRRSIPKNVVVQLFQSVPDPGNAVHSGLKWTNTAGAKKAGCKRASQLLKNCAAISKSLGRQWFYPYDGCIRFMQELCVNDIRKTWKALSSKFARLGCVFAWEIEVTTDNEINFHLTFRDAPEHLMKGRGRKLKAELRPLTKVPLNMQFRPITSYLKCRNQCNYVAKAVRPGFAKKPRVNMETDDVDVILNTTSAKTTDDIHAPKRVLFVVGTGLKKCYHVGPFWEQDRKVMQADYEAKKATRKKKTQAHPEIDTAAKRLADLTQHHEAEIARRLHEEIDAAQAAEAIRIKTHNKELAAEYVRSKPDYDEEVVYEAEQKARREYHAKLAQDIDQLALPPKTPKSFNPADLDSVAAYH